MENDRNANLKSCFYSFVPFVLSIPFLFVYFTDRLSLWTTLFFVLSLFTIHFFLLRRFYSEAVFIRAHILILSLTIGLTLTSISAPIGVYTVGLAFFHVTEYISIGLWSPNTLELKSFLLNHSREYNAAILIAYIEYFIEKVFLFPDGIPLRCLCLCIGLTMMIVGEVLRKLAMYTARQSFSHIIDDKPNQNHRLITYGIYSYYRHPSYVGWFLWAVGTQVLLANPISFIIYLIVSFRKRSEICLAC